MTRGLETGRDSWVYNYSANELLQNVNRMISNYSSLLEPFQQFVTQSQVQQVNEKRVADFLRDQPAAREDFVKWSRSLRTHLAKGVQIVAKA